MKKLSSVSSLPTPAQIEPLLVDIPTAAKMLSSTIWAVRSLLWDKKIPHIKIGKKHLINPADLRSFIQRHGVDHA